MALKPQVKLTQDRSTNADKNQTVLGFEVLGINNLIIFFGFAFARAMMFFFSFL